MSLFWLVTLSFCCRCPYIYTAHWIVYAIQFKWSTIQIFLSVSDQFFSHIAVHRPALIHHIIRFFFLVQFLLLLMVLQLPWSRVNMCVSVCFFFFLSLSLCLSLSQFVCLSKRLRFTFSQCGTETEERDRNTATWMQNNHIKSRQRHINTALKMQYRWFFLIFLFDFYLCVFCSIYWSTFAVHFSIYVIDLH